MPLYDFECSNGHRFEESASLARREEAIPCQGTIDGADGGQPASVTCPLLAHRVQICHARPSTMLDYGLGANRDAARQGRYDPNRPSTRGVRKVQL